MRRDHDEIMKRNEEIYRKSLGGKPTNVLVKEYYLAGGYINHIVRSVARQRGEEMLLRRNVVKINKEKLMNDLRTGVIKRDWDNWEPGAVMKYEKLSEAYDLSEYTVRNCVMDYIKERGK